MPPAGTRTPTIYILGEAPGSTEDEEGVPFVGNAGQYLREHIHDDWLQYLRWNNCIRTQPDGNRTPEDVELECCRPSIQADIEATKPPYIFGFGGVPLKWATGQVGITRWNGRVTPVKIGEHVCWYFALLHPSHILRLHHDPKQFETMSFVFEKNVKDAFAAVERGLPNPVVHSREEATANIECIYSDANAIIEALRELAQEPIVGVDIETKNIRPYYNDSKILSAAIAGAERSVAFPLHHRDARWNRRELQDIEDAFYEFLLSDCQKVSFQLGFELEWLAYFYGDQIVHSPWEDAQAQAFILDERAGSLSLEFVCQHRFGFDIKGINNTDRNRLDETPLDVVLPYNGLDSKYHRLAFLEQKRVMELEQPGLREVYEHHVGRAKAAALCQIKGVPVNQATVRKYDKKYGTRRAQIEAEIDCLEEAQKFKRLTRHAYRPSSQADVHKMLYQIVGASGEGTKEADIKEIRHPIAGLTLDWRGANKVLSTYVEPLLNGHERCKVFPDGLLHPNLKLTKVRTWRSSAEDPNIQNFPKHGEEGEVEVRGQVEAPPNHYLVSFDYGQIQARNVAMESEDEYLVQSFWDRIDIHKYWAERLMRIYPRWVKEGVREAARDKKLFKHYRNKAKNGFVFASFFGASGATCADHLSIPEDIGYQLSNEFWEQFPGVKWWHTKLHSFYKHNGYITGLSGFQRRAPVAYTEVINTPIQSDEAVMVFDAMIRLTERQEWDYYTNFTVHDDLSFIWPKERIDEYAEVVIDTMLDCPFEWSKIVPISVEMSVGKTWDRMEEIGNYESDQWQSSEATYKKAGPTIARLQSNNRNLGT